MNAEKKYCEMVNWMDCELSFLPLLPEISDDEIKEHIKSDSIPDENITFKQSRKPREKFVELNLETDL